MCSLKRYEVVEHVSIFTPELDRKINLICITFSLCYITFQMTFFAKKALCGEHEVMNIILCMDEQRKTEDEDGMVETIEWHPQ